jgi:hypothetical protein
MKKVILFGLFCLQALFAVAQKGLIEGHIYDVNNKPKSNVKVWANGDKKNAVKSNGTGKFAFPTGTVIKSIDIEYPHYTLKSYTVKNLILNVFIQTSENSLRGEIIESGHLLSNAKVEYQDGGTVREARTDAQGHFVMPLDASYTINNKAVFKVNGQAVPASNLSFLEDDHFVRIKFQSQKETLIKNIICLREMDRMSLAGATLRIDGELFVANGQGMIKCNFSLSEKTVIEGIQYIIVSKQLDEKSQRLVLSLKTTEAKETKTPDQVAEAVKTETKTEETEEANQTSDELTEE